MDNDGMLLIALLMGASILGIAVILAVILFNAIPHPFNWVSFGAALGLVIRKIYIVRKMKKRL